MAKHRVADMKSKDPKSKAYAPPPKKVYTPIVNYKPLQVIDKRTNAIIGLALFISVLVVYMLTQARTMSFWDSGEYATCGSILGIPHPPGNPLYIIIARAFCALGGSLFMHAVLVAFISGLFSAFGVLFTYLITVKLFSMFEKNQWLIIAGGLLAALYTAFSYTFWMTSIEAEVNSGMLFFVNLTLWMALVWVEKSEDFSHQNILLLIGYIFFLGFCVHQTALQTAPAVLFIILYPMIIQSIKEGKFWLRAIIFSVVIIILYILAGQWGESIKFPSLGKWLFALIVLGILYFNLKDKVPGFVWLIGFGLVAVGMSPHIFLFVRSTARPFINEGYPHNMQLFMDYILRRQYGVVSFLERRASLAYQFGYHYLRYFGLQWFHAETLSAWTKIPQIFFVVLGNLIAILLGVVGMFDLAKRNKHAFAYLFSIFIMTTIIFIFILNLSDQEVRDRDYFFVSAFNVWAIWMGFGCITLLRPLVQKKALYYILAAILFFLPLINMASQYKIHDRSKEFMALDYGMNFLNSLEENAIIFTNGDNDTFPLWYNQAVKDQYTREYVHPAKDVMPDRRTTHAIRTALDFKNKTLHGIRKDVSVANLSLLNTPWYIRQLRDKEGILFNWSDSLIEKLSYTPPPDMNLSPYPMIDLLFDRTTKTEDGFTLGIVGRDAQDSFTLTYPNFPKWRNEGIFRVSDLAVMKIIQDNYGKRPIYFAVTCENYVGFEKYTRNEGLVSRIVSTYGADQLDISRLLQNTDKIYSYRSITDQRVYKDDNARRLIMNYGAAYDRASSWFLDKGDTAKAKLYLDKAMRFISSDFSKDVRQLNLLLQSKSLEEAYALTLKMLRKPQTDSDNLVFLAKLWYEHRPEVSFEIVQAAIKLFPDDIDLAYFVYDLGLETRQFGLAKHMLEMMKDNLGEAIAPYIDSLDTYQKYLGSTPAGIEGKQTK